MNAYERIIANIDPTANAKDVLDVAADRFRYFSDMETQDWLRCILVAKTKVAA